MLLYSGSAFFEPCEVNVFELTFTIEKQDAFIEFYPYDTDEPFQKPIERGESISLQGMVLDGHGNALYFDPTEAPTNVTRYVYNAGLWYN